MWQDNWLTRQWNAYKENKRIATHHKTQEVCALEAISAKDSQAFQSIIKDTEKSDDFTKNRFSGFLRASIESDDLPTFQAVLSLHDNLSDFHFGSNWGAFECGTHSQRL